MTNTVIPDKNQTLDAVCNRFSLEAPETIFFAALCGAYASYSVLLVTEFDKLMAKEISEE